MFPANRRSALRTARAEAMARISELGARVLADPSDTALAERLATARLLYDQAATPAALAEVSALVAETVPEAPPRPLPRKDPRRARRRSRRRGRPAGVPARRFRPAAPRQELPAVPAGWWRRPLLVVGAFAVVLFAIATSEAGSDVVAHRIAVTVAEVGLGAAVLWLLLRAWPVLTAYRTRRAAVEARLNEIAARVMDPAPATSPEEARERADEAKRYVLLLHSYDTRPLAEVERLLDTP
ncbi:hypothetical protein JCM33774_80490 [Actinophytocola sp. KF-1]